MAPLTNEQCDRRVLVALFRTDLETAQGADVPAVFTAVLNKMIKALHSDGPDGLFLQQCFNDHGPQVILRAIADTYDAPDHVFEDEDPAA